MARRYTRLPGIGRCTVRLDGFDARGRLHAWIYQAVETNRVYLVKRAGRRLETWAVTDRPTAELLEAMSDFHWQISIGSPLDPDDQE